MAFIPNSGSVLAFQGTVPWSVLGAVQTTGSVVSLSQGSIATVIIGGSVAIASPANQSVSGTVGASIIGLAPVNVTNTVTIAGSVAAWLQSSNASVITVGSPVANQSVSGTVTVTGGPIAVTTVIPGTSTTNLGTAGAAASVATKVGVLAMGVRNDVPVTLTASDGQYAQGLSVDAVGAHWVHPITSVAVAIVSGSIAASFTPPANQSISGTVNIGTGGPVSVLGTMSVLGTVPVTQATASNPWIITGSVQASITPAGNQSVSGTVQVDVRSSVAVVIIGGSIATATTNSSVTLLTGVNMIGSVAAYQGSIPWTIGSIYGNISGSVAATITNTNLNVSGSVIAFPIGNQSVSGTVNVGSVLSQTGYVSTVNTISSQLSTSSVFTGTAEEVKDFSAIYVTVFTDTASATDGLSLQRSSNGTNWDITDTYTVPANTGKTFQVQPDARFFRIVYTNSAANQGVMRLQTVYKQSYSKPSSQRPGDGYTNETDLEQMQSFGMIYDETSNTWYRQRGNSSIGTLVYTTSSIVTRSSVALVGANTVSVVSSTPLPIAGSVAAIVTNFPTIQNVSGSVVAFQGGTQITSIIGAYAEDATHTSGDVGVFMMGVRNDTMASITSADGDYTPHITGPVGEVIVANSPITKWVQGKASAFTGIAQPLIAPQGASIFTYVTGVQVVNMSANLSLLSFLSGNSVIGFSAAPASGGSNIVFPNGLKTFANADFAASISGISSVYVSVEGFISKT